MYKVTLKSFTSDILKSELIRNTTVLISGTVLAQLISILLQPLLRRYFSPEAFGAYSVYISLVAIITVLATFRYEDAVVLPPKDADSANVLCLALLFNLIVSFILFIIFLLFGKKIVIGLNMPPGLPVSILYLIPLSVFLFNCYQSFNYWLIRQKKYYQVTGNKLIRRGTEGISQLVFAFLKNPRGLIYSDIIGHTANVISTIYSSVRSGFKFDNVNRKDLIRVMHEYSDFPKFNLLPAIMSACSYYLPTIFINRLYSSEMTGYFDLSKLLLSIPLAFVATSVSNVLLQRISEKFRKEESFIDDLKPIFYIVIVICVLELAAILLFSREIFEIVFGKDWRVSGEISRIMVWSFTMNFFVSSFSCIFISMKKIKIYSIWQFIYFVLILSLLFFKNVEFRYFIKVYVVIEVTCYMLLTGLLIWLVKRYELLLKSLT